MNTRSRAASQTIVNETVENANNSVNKSKRVKSTIIDESSTPSKVQKADALVANLLGSVKKENGTVSKSTELRGNDKQGAQEKTKLPKKTAPKVIRGLPKSGRPWKDVKQKFSNVKKSIYRRSFEKKEQLRNELKHIKELSNSIKQDKHLENVEKKQRREENAKRRLENERKSEIVQIIKNPAKLKRMKKKALRKIEKRDLATLSNSNGPKVV